MKLRYSSSFGTIQFQTHSLRFCLDGQYSSSVERSSRNPNLTMSRWTRRVPGFSSSSKTNRKKNNNSPAVRFDAYKHHHGGQQRYSASDSESSDSSDSYGPLEPRGVGDHIEIEVEENGKNRRMIRSRISIEASLERVWNILTDYERLADFIPGLAVSRLLEKRDNFARLFQIGQQTLAFGLKFKAKGIMDCYEGDLKNLPFGQRREIEFKMTEGDFQLFEGIWSVEQVNTGEYEPSDSILAQDVCTTLSYVLDVVPKVWLPVRIVEGRLCEEIKTNLLSIKRAAESEI